MRYRPLTAFAGSVFLVVGIGVGQGAAVPRHVATTAGLPRGATSAPSTTAATLTGRGRRAGNGATSGAAPTTTTAAPTTTTGAPPTTAAHPTTTAAPIRLAAAPTKLGPAPTVAPKPVPVSTPGPLPPSPIQATDPLVPASGVLFGAWAAPIGGWTQADVMAGVNNLQSEAGRRLDIVHFYYAWTDTFPDWQVTWTLQNGQTPMVSWELADTIQIANGTYDSMIASRADGLKALGQPVLLRWGYEMDGSDAASYVHSAADYIAAWRHIRSIFTARGATNVHFVWCPNAWAITAGYGQQYYPGDAYVDWIGSDGYDWAPARPGVPWQTFTQIFQDWYNWAAPHGKPLIVAEFGVMEDQPGQKGAWWSGVLSGLQSMPAIKAITYFNEDKQDSDGLHDWLVNTSPSSLAGFAALAQNAMFRTRF